MAPPPHRIAATVNSLTFSVPFWWSFQWRVVTKALQEPSLTYLAKNYSRKVLMHLHLRENHRLMSTLHNFCAFLSTYQNLRGCCGSSKATGKRIGWEVREMMRVPIILSDISIRKYWTHHMMSLLWSELGGSYVYCVCVGAQSSMHNVVDIMVREQAY